MTKNSKLDKKKVGPQYGCSRTNFFFGMQFKPGAARKSKRKDSDRLKAIYNQVHDFSLLDPAVQVNNLKNHLIAVGRQRRSNFKPPTL